MILKNNFLQSTLKAKRSLLTLCLILLPVITSPFFMKPPRKSIIITNEHQKNPLFNHDLRSHISSKTETGSSCSLDLHIT